MPLTGGPFISPGYGIPKNFPKVLASATGVTNAAIDLATSTTGYYTIIDSIYISCDSVPTKADFSLLFDGNKVFSLEYDELGVAGVTPIWSYKDYLDPDPAANTRAFWLDKSLGTFWLAPTGDSIKIDGRNAAAGDNYTGTSSVALTIDIHGRLIADDAFW